MPEPLSYTIRIGDFTIRPPYGIYDEPHVAIHRGDGEGGDFSVADLAEALHAFYEAKF